MEEKRCYGCMALSVGAAFCPHCGYPTSKDNEPHQLRQGTVLQDKYLIGKVLGQGGFGITYLGWDMERSECIAVKEYYPATQVTRDTARGDRVHCYTGILSDSYKASMARFLREAQALSRLENVPAVVKIRDCFDLNDTAYIVMEYITGSSLNGYIAMRGGRIGFWETMNILSPVMDALTAVHNMGLIHRDISPDNIVLHPTRGAVLLDFGSVRDVAGADVATPLPKSTEAILKHGFAPMEQYQTRGSLGPWTDVYALCATIYYCLTGRIPPEAVSRTLGEEILDWNAVPELNPRQRAVLEKGMAMAASQRYLSVSELLRDLAEASAAPRQAPAETPKTTPKDKKNLPKKRPVILAVLGLTLCLLGAAIRLLVPQFQDSGREPARISDSVYTDKKPQTAPDTSETTEPPKAPEPEDVTDPEPEDIAVPEREDVTAPKAEGAAKTVSTQTVYYSYTQKLADLGVDCTWNLNPLTIAFAKGLDFTESTTEVSVENSYGEELTDHGIRFTWEENIVYVTLPESMPHGVYHIIIRKGSENLDYVLCSGISGEYYPISPSMNPYGAGLRHETSGLFLVRDSNGLSMTADGAKKTHFDSTTDICGVEYRSGVPYPSVTGETALLAITEYFIFDSGNAYLIQLDDWYLAYNSGQGLHFTKDLTADCHWYLNWA